jgi:nucleoside 2-deoxyribosyltransferase
MSDDPFDDPEWLAYADHVRESLIPMVKNSALSVAMFGTGDPDPKQAIEIGYMVLLDKPIIVTVMPGAKVPNKLARVADEIVEAADDPATTSMRLKAAIKRVAEKRGL